MKPGKIGCSLSAYLLLAGLLLTVFLAPQRGQAQDNDLSVLSGWMAYSDAPNALYHHFSSQAYQQLEARKQQISQVQTKAQWHRRQQKVRQTLEEIVGPFPKKTPLNAQVVDTLLKEEYRVEHLIYESMPGLHVTASLFVPNDLEDKAPAIIYCSGHTANGYRSDTYQHVILNLVQKGFVVLAFDPVGQGERLQYFDSKTGKSLIGGPTSEHSYSGAQAFISGRSQARYMTWDGIRAVDYLVSRPEVDATRIGITGRSGGGTQTAYVAAFDKRIQAAAPENYITGFRRLLQSIGPQDGEQNFYHGLAHGIDHGDLLEVRAPKPTLMLTTTRDFFNIQGARSTYKEAKQAFKTLGQGNHLQINTDDAPHTSTQANREAMYAFFQNHLANPGNAKDLEVKLLTPKELQVTPTGQLLTSLDSKTIFDVNKRETRPQVERLQTARQNLDAHLRAVRKSARRLSGYRAPGDVAAPVLTGRYQRSGYVVEKYFVQGEGDYPIPYLLMVPNDSGPHPALIYLHPEGKSAEASPKEEIEALVKQGYVVLAPDLLNIGEMGPGVLTGDAHIGEVSYNKWFASILAGRSIAGVQAGDVNRLVQLLNNRPDVKSGRIAAVARGSLGPVLLHAAVFEPDLTRIALINAPISYRTLVMNRFYKPAFVHAAVAGALTAYDLPDLAASLAPRPVLMMNAVGASGEPAGKDVLHQELPVIRRAYQAKNARPKLLIQPFNHKHQQTNKLTSWLQQPQN